MYNVKSMKAEEFIDHNEIEETLSYAEANKNNLKLIDSLIEKAKERKGLSHREASVLLACENKERLEEIYALARQIKEDFEQNCNVCPPLSFQLLCKRLRILSLSRTE